MVQLERHRPRSRERVSMQTVLVKIKATEINKTNKST